jgi:hypothetical protein
MHTQNMYKHIRTLYIYIYIYKYIYTHTYRAQGLLWEKGAAKSLVDSGDLRMIGECSPPWPSFVIAAREGLLQGEQVWVHVCVCIYIYT